MQNRNRLPGWSGIPAFARRIWRPHERHEPNGDVGFLEFAAVGLEWLGRDSQASLNGFGLGTKLFVEIFDLLLGRFDCFFRASDILRFFERAPYATRCSRCAPVSATSC